VSIALLFAQAARNRELPIYDREHSASRCLNGFPRAKHGRSLDEIEELGSAVYL
jgi:hypothetical protein